MNYYNEFEPSAIAWLKELIKAGAIPDGHIDTRSICDVQPEDLHGFDQCHFFAGIAGWPEALRLAGYAGIKGLWTGSCPCQPFSAAGKRKGISDARHLWPEMFRLVKACRPQYVLGEQVEAAIRAGWLDGVFGDLEGEGYACGAAVLGAHSVGAPHIRQRLYWGAARVEHATSNRRDERRPEPSGRGAPVRCGEDDRLAEPHGEQRDGRGDAGPRGRGESTDGGRLGNPDDPRPQGYGVSGERAGELSPWAASTTIYCADGKTRRISVEPALFPLAYGVPGRVGLLRGAGNAIVPQVAALFITTFMESIECSQLSPQYQ